MTFRHSEYPALRLIASVANNQGNHGTPSDDPKYSHKSESDRIVSKRDDAGAPLTFGRALTYSAGVMTFQRPEPRPSTTVAQTVVLLETILGPVQAALLALAIRRKFMR